VILDCDRLAWKVYKYLVDRRTGVFHMNEVLEDREGLGEYRTIRDPVKIINVYEYGYPQPPTAVRAPPGRRRVGLGTGRLA